MKMLDEPTGTEKCPSCSKDVYEDADRCPYCGEYIIPGGIAARKWPAWWWIAFGLALFALFFFTTGIF
jgi:predicted RNA-binding Zn-ribbon protein involved in translation (DUF1610 family)